MDLLVQQTKNERVPFLQNIQDKNSFTFVSEPNSRSQSVKTQSRARYLASMEDDRRRNSLPLTTEIALQKGRDDHCDNRRQSVRRVRSFRMTSKGIQNDIEDERRHSNASLYSAESQKDIFRSRHSSNASDDSAIFCGCSSTSSSGYYRICVLGADAVGKTSLTNTFMTSDKTSAIDLDTDDLNEQTLSVVLDGEESTIEFIHLFNNEKDENISADAYLVVFSVHEKLSFDVAKSYVTTLRTELFSDRAIILVANKVDLVRKRKISTEEARRFAQKYNCKYTETSATLNHNVDELLVGVLKQIKDKLNPEFAMESDRAAAKKKGPKGLLNSLFKRNKSTHDVLLDLR